VRPPPPLTSRSLPDERVLMFTCSQASSCSARRWRATRSSSSSSTTRQRSVGSVRLSSFSHCVTHRRLEADPSSFCPCRSRRAHRRLPDQGARGVQHRLDAHQQHGRPHRGLDGASVQGGHAQAVRRLERVAHEGASLCSPFLPRASSRHDDRADAPSRPPSCSAYASHQKASSLSGRCASTCP